MSFMFYFVFVLIVVLVISINGVVFDIDGDFMFCDSYYVFFVICG